MFLSGLGHEVFQPAVAQVRTHARRLGIPAVDVPFFYGTNMPRIKASLDETTVALLRETYTAFTPPTPVA